MDNGKEKIIRSESVNEIIRQSDSFLGNWGLLIVASVIVCAILSSYFITYNNTIAVKVVIQGTNTPKEIISKTGGKVSVLLKENAEVTKENEIIAWIESPDDSAQIMDLYQKIKRYESLLKTDSEENALAIFNTTYSELGEVQSPYENFYLSWSEMRRLLVAKTHEKGNILLHDEARNILQIKDEFKKERELAKKNNEISKLQFEANEHLYKQKVISLDEFRKADAILIGMKSTIPRIEIDILNQESKMIATKRQTIEDEKNYLKSSLALKMNIMILKNSISNWILKYAIKSPTNGKISFSVPLQRDFVIKAGQSIGVVNPENNSYYADLKLYQKNLGEISLGMDASIRIEAYPYAENGVIKGKVSYISDVPVDSFFTGRIALNHGLITSNNMKIPYKNGLNGEAIIITKKTRLLKKMYENVLKK